MKIILTRDYYIYKKGTILKVLVKLYSSTQETHYYLVEKRISFLPGQIHQNETIVYKHPDFDIHAFNTVVSYRSKYQWIVDSYTKQLGYATNEEAAELLLQEDSL